jgi:hypothetical protein
MANAGTNHGLLVRDASEGASGAARLHELGSREAAENRPQLVLRFVAAPS